MLYSNPPAYANVWASSQTMFAPNSNVITTLTTPYTYGNWSMLCPGLDQAGYYITFDVTTAIGSSTLNRSGFIDIGIGPDSGNITVVVPTLCITNTGGAGGATIKGPSHYEFPLYVPPNTKVWARGVANVSLTIHTVLCIDQGARDPSDSPLVHRYEVIGPTPNTSSFTNIITPSYGTGETAGAWSEYSASTSNSYIGVMLSGGNISTAAIVNMFYSYDVGVGTAGSEVVVARNILKEISVTTEQTTRFSIGRLVQIPQGSRICVRGTSILAGGTGGGIILLGMVGQ